LDLPRAKDDKDVHGASCFLSSSINLEWNTNM
jgi:hypothetical protein